MVGGGQLLEVWEVVKGVRLTCEEFKGRWGVDGDLDCEGVRGRGQDMWVLEVYVDEIMRLRCFWVWAW